MTNLIVNEMFTSVDGEVNHWGQGRPSTFIRLSGCNLLCPYCDTKYAQDKKKGRKKSISQIVDIVISMGCDKVTLTGGEPLHQKGSFELIKALAHAGALVSIETNGSKKIPFDDFKDHRSQISWVIDWKTPSSGYSKWMLEENYQHITYRDWVKFVIAEREDFDFMKERVDDLRRKGRVAVSPAYGKVSPSDLVEMVILEGLFDVSINLQLHKIIWPGGDEGIKYSTFQV